MLCTANSPLGRPSDSRARLRVMDVRDDECMMTIQIFKT
jgi:hypothetical protein